MKKIGKLTISPEKIMKNEDLINLQGGYTGWCCECDGKGWMAASDLHECILNCHDAFDVVGFWRCEY